MQISGFSGTPPSYYPISQQPKASPQADMATQTLPNAAGGGQNASTSPSTQQGLTPLQFNSTLLLDLLNATQETGNSGAAQIGSDGLPHLSQTIPAGLHVTPNDMGFTSVTISSDEVPGGLKLAGLNASDAATELISTAGSQGELSLSDIDRVLGMTAPETGTHSPKAVTADEWKLLTGGSGGPLSASQLTKAIQSYLDGQGTAQPQTTTPPANVA
jgi:hypothetical protein